MALATREGAIRCSAETRCLLAQIARNKKYSIIGAEQIDILEGLLDWVEDIPKLYDIIDELREELKKKPKVAKEIVYRGKR